MNDENLEKGKATQFGQPDGPDPVAAAKESHKKHDIRRAIKKLLNAQLPQGDLTDENVAAVIYGPENTAGLSPAERIARTKIAAAIGGNMAAADKLEDSMCGKLVEKRITSEASLAELVSGKFKEDDDDSE